MKIALPKEYLGKGVDPAVADKIKAAAKQFEDMGATVTEVSLATHSLRVCHAYYIIAISEASLQTCSALTAFVTVSAPTMSRILEDVYVRTRSEGFGP